MYDVYGHSSLYAAFQSRKLAVCRRLAALGAVYTEPTFPSLASEWRQLMQQTGRLIVAAYTTSYEVPANAIAETEAVAGFLLELGAKEILAQSDCFWEAVRYPQFSFANLLLDAGFKDVAGCPPLGTAHVRPEQMSQEAGGAETAVHTCLHSIVEAVCYGRSRFEVLQDFFRRVVELGIDINQGEPVLYALASFQWGTSLLLLDMGATPSIFDNDETEAIHVVLRRAKEGPPDDNMRRVMGDAQRRALQSTNR